MIRAPFDGIIVSKDAQVGEMVSPVSAGGGFTRTGIATLVDMNSNEIEVDVNEAYIARVEPGQPVTAVLDAYPDWQIPSKVRTVIPTADRQKATVKVRISFLKLDPRILPDMGIKVTFLGASRRKKVLRRPLLLFRRMPCVTIMATRLFFWLRMIKSSGGPSPWRNARGTDSEIMAGLMAGDSVVVKGPANLRDGQAVEIKK